MQTQIAIGAILPLTGDGAFYGESIQRALDLATEEINKSGGINGRKINIIYEDSKASPMEGVNAFNKLVQIDKVQVVIGGAISSVTLAIAPIANKEKIVFMSPLSSAPEITNAGDFIFRNVPSDLYGGKVAAYFAIKYQGWKSAAILYVSNDFGTSLANVFSNEVERLGGKIVDKESYVPASTDFRAQLVIINSEKPDVIFVASYREAAQIFI